MSLVENAHYNPELVISSVLLKFSVPAESFIKSRQAAKYEVRHNPWLCITFTQVPLSV